MTTIRIAVGDLDLIADLNDSDTAEAIVDALPIEGSASIWGDEIYFSIPVSADLDEGARAVVAMGELAYWPPGDAFCIFWGPPPASQSLGEIRAASEVNPVGQLRAIPVPDLRSVQVGEVVRMELYME